MQRRSQQLSEDTSSRALNASSLQVFGRTAYEASSAWFRSMVISSEAGGEGKLSGVLMFRFVCCTQTMVHQHTVITSGIRATWEWCHR